MAEAYRDGGDKLRKEELHRRKHDLSEAAYRLRKAPADLAPQDRLLLKRRGYGLFNQQHWFQRSFLDLEGYRWFGLACPPYMAPTTPDP